MLKFPASVQAYAWMQWDCLAGDSAFLRVNGVVMNPGHLNQMKVEYSGEPVT
jgi:hypothetical protein